MSIKVFQTNANGKIEFTRCELEKLLNETYDEGYRAGENQAKGQCVTEKLDDICAKAAIETKVTPTNHNGAKAAVTTCINNEPPRTYTIDLGKNSDFDFDSMAKLLGEVLYGHPKQSAHGELTDPFVSLEKELSGI